VSATIGALVVEAKSCDPAATNPCGAVVAGAPDCACPTHVNGDNVEAIEAIMTAHAQYNSLMCGASPCDCASPGGAYCAPNGRCVDVFEYGAACQVGESVYPSGAGGFAGPLGCHTCECHDGELTCTDEACNSACPPNSVEGSQCAQCGPDDGCEVVEYGCLPVCDTDCDSGVCLEGVCRNVCG
jgi:hypothetical protein